jgi:hypothetical protein
MRRFPRGSHSDTFAGTGLPGELSRMRSLREGLRFLYPILVNAERFSKWPTSKIYKGAQTQPHRPTNDAEGYPRLYYWPQLVISHASSTHPSGQTWRDIRVSYIPLLVLRYSWRLLLPNLVSLRPMKPSRIISTERCKLAHSSLC